MAVGLDGELVPANLAGLRQRAVDPGSGQRSRGCPRRVAGYRQRVGVGHVRVRQRQRSEEVRIRVEVESTQPEAIGVASDDVERVIAAVRETAGRRCAAVDRSGGDEWGRADEALMDDERLEVHDDREETVVAGVEVWHRVGEVARCNRLQCPRLIREPTPGWVLPEVVGHLRWNGRTIRAQGEIAGDRTARRPRCRCCRSRHRRRADDRRDDGQHRCDQRHVKHSNGSTTDWLAAHDFLDPRTRTRRHEKPKCDRVRPYLIAFEH